MRMIPVTFSIFWLYFGISDHHILASSCLFPTFSKTFVLLPSKPHNLIEDLWSFLASIKNPLFLLSVVVTDWLKRFNDNNNPVVVINEVKIRFKIISWHHNHESLLIVNCWIHEYLFEIRIMRNWKSLCNTAWGICTAFLVSCYPWQPKCKLKYYVSIHILQFNRNISQVFVYKNITSRYRCTEMGDSCRIAWN